MKYSFIIVISLVLVSCHFNNNIESGKKQSKAYDTYLNEMTVIHLDSMRIIDEKWDKDSSGTDLSAALFKGVATSPIYTTTIQRHIYSADLPVDWPTPAIRLNNTFWRLVLYKNNLGYQQEMAQFSFNGNTKDTTIHLTNMKGYAIKLTVEKRPR